MNPCYFLYTFGKFLIILMWIRDLAMFEKADWVR